MGAWGYLAWENDDGVDLLGDLLDADDLSPIDEALDVKTSGHLETPDGSRILAAAEVLAALRGKPAAGFPQNLSAWVADHRTAPISRRLKRALTHLESVLSQRSGLRTLWEADAAIFPAWEKSVRDLISRLELP